MRVIGYKVQTVFMGGTRGYSPLLATQEDAEADARRDTRSGGIGYVYAEFANQTTQRVAVYCHGRLDERTPLTEQPQTSADSAWP